MPYKIQLQDARNSGTLKSISNVSTASPQFVSLLNEAMDGLAIRGNWYELEQCVSFCLSSCNIVWPEFVGTILGVRFCSGLASVQNEWYSFVNNNYGQNWGSGFGGINGGYGGVNGGLDGFFGRKGTPGETACVFQDAPSRPCYNEITGTTGKTIRYCVVNSQDYGKTITLFGTQYGAQPLQEKDSGGSTVNGMTLTAANPYGTSATLVTKIDSVVRQPTVGMAYLYEYDSNTGLMRDLAAYKPNETNPRYRTSRISNIPYRKADENGVCWTSVQALVKLKFIPVCAERDFLMLDNLRAVKFAMQAVILERANNDAEAEIKWAMAVKELNLELDDKKPQKQMPVRINLGRTISNPI